MRNSRSDYYGLTANNMVLKVLCHAAWIMTFLTIQIAFGQGKVVMTVNGPLPVDSLGKTLIHEHIITDFSGTDSRNVGLSAYTAYADSILPRLIGLKAMGYRSLVECTPAHIGRNVEFLKYLSSKSGLNILTNTGFYAAVDKKYLPPIAESSTVEELAAIWENEWVNGIGGTAVRPAFIKLGVGSGPLDPVEEKLVSAGMLTSKRTGLALYVHTGGDESIRSQADLAKQMGFDLNKLVWVHAQNGSDEVRQEMARLGVWVSLDGVNEQSLDAYLQKIRDMKDAGLLHRLLISHDDGWSVANEGGKLEIALFSNGNISPYTTIEEYLLPALSEIGVSQEEIVLLLVKNPAKALAIRDVPGKN